MLVLCGIAAFSTNSCEFLNEVGNISRVDFHNLRTQVWWADSLFGIYQQPDAHKSLIFWCIFQLFAVIGMGSGEFAGWNAPQEVARFTNFRLLRGIRNRKTNFPARLLTWLSKTTVLCTTNNMSSCTFLNTIGAIEPVNHLQKSDFSAKFTGIIIFIAWGKWKSFHQHQTAYFWELFIFEKVLIKFNGHPMRTTDIQLLDFLTLRGSK